MTIEKARVEKSEAEEMKGKNDSRVVWRSSALGNASVIEQEEDVLSMRPRKPKSMQSLSKQRL